MIEIEGCLKERDTSANDFSLSSPLDGNDKSAAPASATDPDVSGTQSTQRNGVSIKPTRRQIEQRIEEDRERHKRMRESMWVVPSNPIDQARKFFAETSGLGEDDRILGDEDIVEFRVRVKDTACTRHRPRGSRREERPSSRPRPRATNGVPARHYI